ncbi:MAG: M14 family metallopeptidase [Pirellulales bacterium]|nr:M14 family metallopeptidase [Pirellulales bacterium]
MALVLVSNLAQAADVAAPPSAPVGSANSAAATAVGSPRAVYQPTGAPADPRVDVRWNIYHDYDASTRILQALAAAHPRLATLSSLGKSTDKREMWVLTIANPGTGSLEEKAAFWIDGGIHANEIQATEVTLYTAWYLLESYGRNERVTSLVNERVFYICPMLSPDSRDAHFYRANTTHTPRTGQVPVDDDQDGKFNEDPPNDLNGDGHITQMRRRDPNGNQKPHPDFPDLLIPAKLDEPGEYTLLGEEGYDDDGDGRVNEDGDGRYDPNRDWAWNWQPRHVQNGAHRYPFSLPENRVVAEFIMRHPHIAGAQSYHNTGGMILRGPGARDDRYEAADLAVYDQLGKRGESMLPGYRYINIAEDLYEVYGGSVDWLHQMNGVFTFTNELFTPFNFQRKEVGGEPFARPELLHQFNRDLLLGDGLVKWQTVTHPKYGQIEVGGMKKNWVRQPPSFLLEEECHRNMAFTLYHADQMPRVAIQSAVSKALTAEKTDQPLYEVTAVIINEKLIPTHAAVDVKHNINPPDKVTLSGDNLTVLASQWSEEPFFEKPRTTRKNPREVRLPNLPGKGARYIKWIIQGSGPGNVRVQSVKGGVAEKTVKVQ